MNPITHNKTIHKLNFTAVAVLVISIVSADTDTNSMTMEHLGGIELFQTILYFNEAKEEVVGRGRKTL